MADPQTITASDFHGRVYAVQLRDSADGTIVADLDVTGVLAGTTEVTGTTGHLWTVEGEAEIGPYGPPWVDVTGRVTHATWSYGRDSELEAFPPGEATLTLTNDDRTFDPEHTTGPYFGRLQPRTPFRLRLPNTDSLLELAAAPSNGGRAQTPDSASLDLTGGDLDVRLEATRDWELVNGAQEVLAAKYQPVDGGRSWWWALWANGRMQLIWSLDGTATNREFVTSTAPVPAAAAQRGRLAVRVTLEADNGFGQYEVRFRTAPSIDGPWTQLGEAVTADGAAQIHNGTADLTVGSAHGGLNAIIDAVTFTGSVHAFGLLDGIGGEVLADPDFTAQQPGTTTFTDATGNAWTIAAGDGTAAIIADPEPVDLFTGYVEDGFEQDYQPPAKGEATVTLVDLQGLLHGTPLGKHAYEGEVLADDPDAYWPMDEAEGTSMGDRSGNEHAGAYDAGIVGAEGLVVGSEHAFEAASQGGNRGRYQGESLPFGPPLTIEAWIRTPRDLRLVKTILGVQEDFTSGFFVFLGIGAEEGGPGGAFLTPNGELLVVFGNGRGVRGHVRVDDNRVHHVALTITADDELQLYVDGTLQDQTVTLAGDIPSWPTGRLWSVGDLTNPGGDFGIDGLVGQVAVYDHVLSPGRIAEHHAAGATAFEGETTGQRLRRILRVGGIPEVYWDIADGDTTVGAAVYGNASIGQHADKVAESEQGTLHIDHRRGGRVSFRSRYARQLDTRSASVQHALTDADTPGALHYERNSLEVTPNGIDGIVNVAEVNWRAGTEVVEDPDSVDAYGAQSRTLETDSPSARVARSSGRWLIHRHATPQARVKAFALNPAADTRVLAAALGARISDRTSFTRHPLAVATPSTTGLYIEGVAHEVHGAHWDTTVRTSSADGLGQVWVWDSDAWDETTVWG